MTPISKELYDASRAWAGDYVEENGPGRYGQDDLEDAFVAGWKAAQAAAAQASAAQASALPASFVAVPQGAGLLGW